MVWIGRTVMPGQLQIDQEHGDAGVARLCVPIGTDKRKHPVGEVAVGGPHLVTVDDKTVAVEHRARREAGRGRMPEPGSE